MYVLSILQAGMDNRVIINSVDINGTVKNYDTTDNILKIKKIERSTLYDSLELSINTVDQISRLIIFIC